MEKKRVGFINKSATGLWGTLTFDDEKFYIRNVRKLSEGKAAADVQVDTGETFLNKANKVCKRYKTIGALLMEGDTGVLSMEFHGQAIRESFEMSDHSGQKGDYKRLTFAEPNPYLAGLMNTVNRGEPLNDQGRGPVATEEIPDELPF